MIVTCPGCGEVRELGPEVQPGAVMTCTRCAGVLFRLTQQGGQYVLHEVPQASCPQCQALQLLPDTIQPGDIFRHCDRSFVVSYAYGAYALTPLARHHVGQRESVTEPAGGGEGGTLNCAPSADAVAGNGAPLNWRPSADAVAGRATHAPV